MAFIRVVTLFFSITYYNYVAGLQVDYTENIPIFDAKIGCDIAKLAWDYASKLLPAQRNLHSVYDALELHKCNTTNYRKAVETK